MNRKDMAAISAITAAVASVVTADYNGAACDLLHHDACRISSHVGDSGDTLSGSVEINLEVEHSDDDSTWSDCADADITDAVTGATTGTFAHIDAPGEDSAIFSTQYMGSKRYVRIVVNVVGTHTNGTPIASWYDRARPSGG